MIEQGQSWYLAREGRQMGPYAGQDIVRLAEKGELRPDDFVWRPGFDGWKPVHTIAGLAAPTSDPTTHAIDAAGPSPEGAVQEESAPQAAAGRNQAERPCRRNSNRHGGAPSRCGGSFSGAPFSVEC